MTHLIVFDDAIQNQPKITTVICKRNIDTDLICCDYTTQLLLQKLLIQSVPNNFVAQEQHGMLVLMIELLIPNPKIGTAAAVPTNQFNKILQWNIFLSMNSPKGRDTVKRSLKRFMNNRPLPQTGLRKICWLEWFL
jgi:hypothetical protein